ncbi:RNA recognition domain-containing protein-containing protein [Tricharina praecox]|uniref:RNA recognition domain-containing protein-containing protein n=1 Tax=Tricharina praecox TaxID=43433 RepID=UPI002220AF54|nr:RNA recognition domain-containing protein-containing protein [Tricharina praecox]KAI5851924.1 RNA recognition domain-containing protein-containing protein [Tricharina praecox]
MAKTPKPTAAAASTTTDHETAVKSHEQDILKRRTLFVRSLDYSVTSALLSEKFSFVAPIKHATVVVNPSSKESRGFGFVTFADAEDALKAIQQLNGADFEGRKMKVELAEPRRREAAKGAKPGAEEKTKENKLPLPTTGTSRPKKVEEEEGKRRSPRLIIRNLPWSVQKPEQLLKYFQSYGKVKDVIIPKKRNGEMSGFAFVTMKGYKNAERAIEATNGTEIEGRTVAVDWAVEKEEWEKARKDEEPAAVKDEVEEEDDDDDDQEEDEDVDGGVDIEDDDEEEGSDAENEDDEMDEDEDDEDDEDDDEDRPPTDSTTTLFIRNLPYSATDDSLYKHFTQFGPVHYSRVVIDHATDRPKGTGFVCFYNPDIAADVLRDAPRITAAESRPSLLQSEALDPDGKYTLDGRILALSRAVDRNQADELASSAAKNREKTNNDKRRLYLINEGMIPASSPAWKKLSPSERLLRDQSREQRRKLLQADPNLHLSLTRLSIRNLPRWVTSKDLKQIARKAIPGFAEDMKSGLRAALSKEELYRDGGEGKDAEEQRRTKGLGVVKQAKVQLEKMGGRSRGYGFVEYWSHRYALMGLRYMNGQLIPGVPQDEEGAEPRRRLAAPDIEKKKRLIVEFAIENAKVVNRRKENETRSREVGEKRREEAKAGVVREPKGVKGKKPTGAQKELAKSKRKREGGDGPDMKELKKRKNWNQKTVKKPRGKGAA